MSSTVVSINLVVLNGEKYIRHCLDAIKSQSYPHNLIEINILDNGSSDSTKKIIRENKLYFSDFMKFELIESNKNYGTWPGQEELFKYSQGKYIVALSVDVILDKDFVLNSVKVMDGDCKVGALQAKIYNYSIIEGSISKTRILDTLGFEIYKSRRIANIGHGVEDMGQYDNDGELKEIFAVEGAVPVINRDAIDDCRIEGNFIDPDYFWYGDDLDWAWRMNMMSWKQVYAPNVVAFHDRQTTKTVRKNWFDYFKRIPIRRQIPIRKRRLDWRNVRFTIIKNDYTINILKDLPRIAVRELMVLIYSLFFEIQVLAEVPNLLRQISTLLRRRNELMKKASVSPKEIRKWYK